MAIVAAHVNNQARKIVKAYAFTLSGAGTTFVDWNRDDLSAGMVLVAEAKLISAAAGAGDSIDIRIQETVDGIVYNDRGRFNPWLGNVVVTPTAPARQRMNIIAHDQLAVTEDVYTDTGGVGGAAIAPGSTREGPFIGFYRDAAGRHPGMRFAFILAGGGAAFSGILDVWLKSSV